MAKMKRDVFYLNFTSGGRKVQNTIECGPNEEDFFEKIKELDKIPNGRVHSIFKFTNGRIINYSIIRDTENNSYYLQNDKKIETLLKNKTI